MSYSQFISIMTELVLGAVRLLFEARQVSIRCRSALVREATVYRLTVYSPCGWEGAGSTPSLDCQLTVGRGEPGRETRRYSEESLGGRDTQLFRGG